MQTSNPVGFLRKAGLVEGISFMLLAGIAMPLKYIWGMPMGVKVLGWLHGILFMIFCLALARVMLSGRWDLGRGALVFVAALFPFGPFLIDRRMREYEREWGKAAA